MVPLNRLAVLREKVAAGERLSFDDGLFLQEDVDLFTLGELANHAHLPLARAADFVLAGASYVEKEASYSNGQGRLQGTARAMAPPGDAMEDWQILVNVARAFGVEMEYSTAAQVRAAIAARFADAPGLAGLPALSVVAAVAFVVYALMLYALLTQDALGSNNSTAIGAMLIVAAVAVILYPIAFLANRRGGVDVSLVGRELPPE